MRTLHGWDRVVTRIESAHGLDRLADGAAGLARRLIRPGPVEDQLSGVPIGHPVHPALVAIPIGAWTSALALDATGQRRAARTLTGLGCATAIPTAAAGASDWLSTRGAERRVGLVHAVVNDSALLAYAASWRARRRERHLAGIGWSLIGGALLAFGGALGGHLAYAQGVGVDTTAFQHVPTDWTDVSSVAAIPDDGALHAVRLGDAVLAVSRNDDRWSVLAGRCTHRGGPIYDGDVRDGCVTCPWHGSRFTIADGAVVSGPATRPQPTFESRVRDGRLEIRRCEERALRTRPV